MNRDKAGTRVGPNEQDELILHAVTWLREADALVIAAGAGMGVDSGLPDFRGRDGFWRAYPAVARLGLAFEEMANPEWFHRDPHLAWAFYGHRLNLYRETEPHAGFGQLLELGKRCRLGSFVFTSNVDGHFQRAGFDGDRVVECHGSIHHWQCAARCSGDIWPAEGERVEVDEAAFRARDPLPQCRRCGGVARPNILMFGDGLWMATRTREQEARWAHWLDQLERCRARVVVIELGAGSAIPTVRWTSERLVDRLDGTLIRINPRECAVPAGHVGLACGAAEGVHRLRESIDR